MNAAMRSKLEPFKKFVRMLRSHLDGVLAWTKTRQWRRRGDAQQDQVDQPSLLRIPQRPEFHRSHLSQLRSLAAACRRLITLFGQEPEIGWYAYEYAQICLFCLGNRRDPCRATATIVTLARWKSLC